MIVPYLSIYIFALGATGTEGFAAARELTFVHGIQDLLPAGVRGLMLTGLLAALASTLDTHLNWGASYWSNDVYQRLVCQHWLKRTPKSRELVVAARLSNILILAIALTVMANLSSIQQAWYLSLLFGAGMGSVLVLRWLWERINLYCEIAAIACSLIAAPLLMLTVQRGDLQLLGMAAISTTAVITAALFLPKTDEHRLVAFYRRVRPPGWWQRTARAAGLGAAGPALAAGLRRDAR